VDVLIVSHWRQKKKVEKVFVQEIKPMKKGDVTSLQRPTLQQVSHRFATSVYEEWQDEGRNIAYTRLLVAEMQASSRMES
jgi:hypothetical protein